MKRLIFLLIVFFCGATGISWSQANMYDCDAYSPLTQADLENTDHFYRPCVAFVPGTDYNLTGDIDLTVSSATIITAADGLFVHDLAPGAEVYMKPGQGTGPGQEKSVDVNIMNYPGFDDILTYKRMELGVVLPEETRIKVDHFVNKTDTSNLNPFLAWELRVYAILTPPANSGLETIVVDGFYNREFSVSEPNPLPVPLSNGGDRYSNPEYDTVLGEWTPQPDIWPFLIRFSPPATGDWSARIFIQTPDGTEESDPIPFGVIDGQSPGYVKVGSSARFLSYNGKTFMPVGCNMFWPETDTIVDPELHNYLCGMEGVGTSTPYYAQYSEGYRDVYVAPRVYRKFREKMTTVANHGGNWFRIIMEPQSTDIEWEHAGDYSDRLHMAHELDNILEHAENLGVFLHWNLQLHYNFNNSVDGYSRQYTWDQHPKGETYCYSNMPGIEEPLDFFTNEEAKKYYKQRLRYIMARWGYSTNIGMFELFSEISNAGYTHVINNDTVFDYAVGDNYLVYQEWQKEMAAYVKSQYGGKTHLLTSSYGTPKHWLDDTYSSPAFDVISINSYDFGAPDFGDFFVKEVSGESLNEVDGNIDCLTKTLPPGGSSSGILHHIKPLIFSETEPSAHTNPLKNEHCGQNYIELKRALWQGMFSGLAFPVPWTASNWPVLYPEFGRIQTVMDGLDLDGQQWHPVTSDLIYYPEPRIDEWRYNSEYADDVLLNKNVDAVFLRSGDGNFAYGVISNKTLNSSTVDTYTCHDYDEDGFPIAKEIVEPTDGGESGDPRRISIRMPHDDKYYVNYYHLDDDITHFGSSDNNGNKVALKDIYLHPDINEFMVLVEIRREGYTFPNNGFLRTNTDQLLPDLVANIESPNPENSNLLRIYPSPTTGLFTIASAYQGSEAIILSSEGRLVKQLPITASETTVDLSSFGKGTYFIQIQNGENTLARSKIVKM